MLSKEQVKIILLEASKTGADFVDLFIEDTKDMSILMEKEQVKDVNQSNLYGAGLRLLHGMEEIYGTTTDVSFEGLLILARKLNKFFDYERVIDDIAFTDTEVNRHTRIKNLSTNEPLSLKIDYLKRMNTKALELDNRIIQAIARSWEHVQNILVANTKGVYKTDVRNVMRFSVSVIAQNENGKQDGSANYGGNFGLDAYKDFSFESLAEQAVNQALVMLDAPQVKGGVYDVVINNAFGGVIFHEACGHSLEATSVARGMSVFANKLGQKIAADCVTAIDDGTIPNEWGSENIDDEGHKTQKNVLIENGILKSYMVDFKHSRIMNHPCTGSGRRQSYNFMPTSRMTNTYIANGPYSLEDIIQATKKGIFAKSLGGGSVNPATGEYNFSVMEGYLIEDGKITTPIRGATLIGNGSETLLNIDMVGNNQTFGYGMCGSMSGSIPACVGQPTIRVRNMIVGGNGGNE